MVENNYKKMMEVKINTNYNLIKIILRNLIEYLSLRVKITSFFESFLRIFEF